MVRNITIFKQFFLKLIIVVFFSVSAYAAEFSATVDKTELTTEETLNLSFKLLGESTGVSPDINELKENFDVISNSQFSNEKIINTVRVASHEWNFVLEPKKAGDFEIPAITISAKSQELVSKPIKIKVNQAKQLGSSAKNNNIFVVTNATKTDPYLNEPIIYQVKLYTKLDLSNTIFDTLVLEDAIVQPLGGYKVSDAKHNGLDIKVIELSYLITPLKAGKLIIPSQKIKGTVITNEVKKTKVSAGGISSLFDNLVDDQTIITKSESFKVANTGLVLDVKPQAIKINPWIPAENISIRGKWGAESFEVGKPIQYTIDIDAKGITSKQLPNFSTDDLKNPDYKIYADISNVKENIDISLITSSKSQTYTIIPLKAGKLTLPQIKINWWDVKNKKMSCTSLNPSPIEVAQGVSNQTILSTTLSNTKLQLLDNTTELQDDNTLKSSYRLSEIIIILITIIILVMMSFFYYLRDNKNFAWYKKFKIPGKQNKLEMPKFDTIKSAKELRDFLQNYAHKHWQTPVNSSLEIIFNTIAKQNPNIKKTDYLDIMKQLEGALYANEKVDIEKLDKECKLFIKHSKKLFFTRTKKKKVGLPDLNP